MARRRSPVPPSDHLNMQQVADAIGVEIRTVRRPTMRAALPVEYDPLTGAPYVRRGPLLKWMAARGYPDIMKRRLLVRRDAPVLSLGVPVAVRTRLRACRLSPVAGPVSLGRLLVVTPPRAVVFGIDWLPAGRAEAMAEEIRRAEDRPALVGIGDRPLAEDVFDEVVPAGASAGDVHRLLTAVPMPARRYRRVS